MSAINTEFGNSFYGEMKQNRWIEQVEEAIAKVSEPSLRSLLERLRGYSNIPRSEKKFINFLSNSLKVRNMDLCSQVPYKVCLENLDTAWRNV